MRGKKYIFSLLLMISLIILTYYFKNMLLLNNIFILIGICIYTLICYLFIVGLYRLRNKLFKTIIIILMFISLIINSIGIYYLGVTDKFIKKFDNEIIEYEHYYLFSLKNNNINNIEDLKDKNIGVTESNKDKISKYIDVKVNSKVYSNITDLITSLYVEELDVVLVNDIEKYVWQEYDDEFYNKIKLIKSFKKKKSNKTNSNINNVSINTEDSFIIYISGIDNNGTISTIGRSDVNIVVTVNPKTKQILLTSIPRDYYVQLHGTTGIRDKLTHAGIYGIDMSVNTIEDILGIDINYYAKVNFNTVTDLINMVGGVDIYSQIALRHCGVNAGNNHLDGKKALCFARERKAYVGGDRQRGVNQEIVIEALINKISTSKDLLLKYNDVLNIVNKNLNTNIGSDFIKQMVGFQLDKMPTWNVRFLNLDGYGRSEYTYSGGNMVLYVMEPNYDTVNNAKRAINDVLNDKLFSEMNYTFTK